MIQILIKAVGESVFTDRTDQIADFNITQGITKEATVGQIVVNYYPGKYQPTGNDEIKIYDGANLIFGGFIVRLPQTLEQGPVIVYSCDLKNYVHRLDYKLVNTSYSNQTAHDIILNIVSLFSGPGITTVNVENDLSAVIDYIPFNNVAPSEAIQQIADNFNKEWYIDPLGDLHFFSKFSEVAPFSLDDTGGKYIFDSLELSDDYTQIKNSILVTGGQELSASTLTEKFIGDANQFTFVMARKYSGMTITDNGTPLTIGIVNIDTFATKNVLYDVNTQSIQFDAAAPPAAGHTILVTGYYYFPIAVRYRLSSSIAKYGERQFLIQDNNISTRADAMARASAEVEAYGEPVQEGKFMTNESGLVAGQKIHISSVLRGISGDYIIQRLSGRLISPSKFEWTAEIVSVRTYELIDLLAQIIKGRRIVGDQNAVIQTAERLNRGVTVSRLITVRVSSVRRRGLRVARATRTYVNSPPIWVAGPYNPTSIDDRKRKAFADRRCLIT